MVGQLESRTLPTIQPVTVTPPCVRTKDATKGA